MRRELPKCFVFPFHLGKLHGMRLPENIQLLFHEKFKKPLTKTLQSHRQADYFQRKACFFLIFSIFHNI